MLPDGELLELGGKAIDADDGPDLLGVIVGSEGTLGIAVEVTLRIVRQPEAVVTQLAAFTTIDAAGDAVSRIVAAGILPSAMEIMDRFTIQAAEEAYRPGYPEGAGAVLLVELDGVAVQVEEDTAAVDDALPRGRGVRDPRPRATPRSARSCGSAARVRSPRWGASRPTTTSRTASCRARSSRRCCAGSTSCPRSTASGSGTCSTRATATSIRSSSTTRPWRASTSAPRRSPTQILAACVEAGGSLTGEHGIGVDKACAMPSMFSERDLEVFERVRRAFDPDGLANPGKVIPTPRLCGEVPGPYRIHPLERLGLAERL